MCFDSPSSQRGGNIVDGLASSMEDNINDSKSTSQHPLKCKHLPSSRRTYIDRTGRTNPTKSKTSRTRTRPSSRSEREAGSYPKATRHIRRPIERGRQGGITGSSRSAKLAGMEKYRCGRTSLEVDPGGRNHSLLDYRPSDHHPRSTYASSC
jgi:hypothetical protein